MESKTEQNTCEKMTILVVDDIPDGIQILTEVLSGSYKIKAATNGKKALTLAQSEDKPDLILLDIMMPEMDGFEVCRQLKSNPVTQPG